ncbi:MAG: glycoside hydrolase family 18 protein [Bacteroidota bacterium]
MFRISCFGIILCMFFGACTEAPSPKTTPPPYRLIGYASDLIPRSSAKMLTHINFAFANVVDGQVIVEAKDSVRLAKMSRLRTFNPDLQILLSIGGWSWSDGFSDAALTDSSRNIFARSAIRAINQFELDGIDIDWEYPAQPGDNNPHRPEDTQNYTLLLQTLRQYLDAQSHADQRSDRPYLLTVATAANQRFLDLTEMDVAHQYLDFVNVMTYDFYGAWTPNTGHHSNLFPSDAAALVKRSAKQAIEEHLAAGIPKDKLVMGAAFYGRGWKGVEANNHGLHQPYGGEAFSAGYKDLLADWLSLRGTQTHWDSLAAAPYLWHPDSAIFVGYEDSVSMRLKANFVRQEALGGIMFWHIRHDTADILLGSLYHHLQGR